MLNEYLLRLLSDSKNQSRCIKGLPTFAKTANFKMLLKGWQPYRQTL